MNIGAIGCGDIMVLMAKACDQLSHTHLVHFADVNVEVAARWAEEHGARHSADYQDLLDDPDVEIVYVASPHHLHCEMTLAALEHDKHVLVEKPMALSLEDMDRMVTAAERRGRHLAVCLDTQFRDHAELVRTVAIGGGIGRIMATVQERLLRKPDNYWDAGYNQVSRTRWRRLKKEAGGGILLMNMIHEIDWALHLCGTDVVSIYAEQDNFGTPDVEVEDFVSAVVRYRNGAIGTIICGSRVPGSRPMTDGVPKGVEIIGTEGRIRIDEEISIVSEAACVEQFGLERGKEVRYPSTDPVERRRRFVEALLAAIASGGPPPVSLYRARRSVEIILAGYRSAIERRPIMLN